MTDLVSLIEAAYAGDGDDRAWLERILELSRPWLDDGMGAAAFLYDARGPGVPRVWAPVAVASPWADQLPELLPLAFAAAPAEITERFFSQRASYSTASVELGLGARIGQFPMFRDVLRQLGVEDAITICASDPSGVGCFMSGPRARPTRPRRHHRALWSRLSAHVAAGARLRRGGSTVEAVLRPDGRLDHGEGEATTQEARDELAQAARNLDRARGRLRRRDPEGALEVWRGLVDGRWSLVDHFDHDGRRYLLARKNEPSLPSTGTLPLTARERQILAQVARGWSNKTIAYHLGLSPSAVSTHLSNAMKKLGARNRVEAASAFRRRP